MPKVVTFSLFLGLSISSCAVWADAWLHQQQSKAASIFRMTSSLSSWQPARTRRSHRGDCHGPDCHGHQPARMLVVGLLAYPEVLVGALLVCTAPSCGRQLGSISEQLL